MTGTGEDFEKIGPTALVTAYAWYRLGMAYGELFATRKGAALYWTFAASADVAARAVGMPALLGYLEFRHRMLEVQLRRLNPDLIIELGAGLSRRGITWALDPSVDTDYIEIDLPAMSAHKRRLLEAGPEPVQRALAQGPLRLLSTDILALGFAEELAQLCAGRERPVVVSEGMLDYFDLSERARLLTNLAAGFRAAGLRGHYLTDLQRADRERGVGAAATMLRAGIRVVTRGRGTKQAYRDLAHLEEAREEAGFDSGEELNPRLLGEDDGRIGELRSPTTIWLLRVDGSSDS